MTEKGMKQEGINYHEDVMTRLLPLIVMSEPDNVIENYLEVLRSKIYIPYKTLHHIKGDDE